MLEPSGLLAAGGNLQVGTLREAYYRGIFPWYSEGEPPLWWSPETRAVLLPGNLRLSRSTLKLIRRNPFEFTCDQRFADVIGNCSSSRGTETWIVPEIQRAYTELHRAGDAHSLEVLQDQTLVGGLYGVQVGSIFCGESMFHSVANASKLAFTCLAETLFANGFKLIDCQIINPFLESLGVIEIPRATFETLLIRSRDQALVWPTDWR